MEKITITFSRVYEYDVSEIHNKLTDEGYEDVEMTEDLIKEKAKDLAEIDLFCELDILDEKGFSSKIEMV